MAQGSVAVGCWADRREEQNGSGFLAPSCHGAFYPRSLVSWLLLDSFACSCLDLEWSNQEQTLHPLHLGTSLLVIRPARWIDYPGWKPSQLTAAVASSRLQEVYDASPKGLEELSPVTMHKTKMHQLDSQIPPGLTGSVGFKEIAPGPRSRIKSAPLHVALFLTAMVRRSLERASERGFAAQAGKPDSPPKAEEEAKRPGQVAKLYEALVQKRHVD
ncbi:Synaptogyrin-2 [Platysternon megacephalum]|uniref:Synaptogyrin-2 n=1 Tax=Platysternon megacephalum TaxID=55544 RepID=A0A4D9EGT5_9SAUR|nr:Synaptogyrin-2 [Platysternon megacephalum]